MGDVHTMVSYPEVLEVSQKAEQLAMEADDDLPDEQKA